MKTSHIIGALLVLASAAGCEREAPTAPRMAANTATGNVDGRIAFSSDRNYADGGGREIYSMNVDGTDVVRLTNNPAVDWFPAWSPDGTQIAFESDRAGRPGIYRMNADGTDVVQLTDDGRKPAWCGDQIAFTRSVGGLAIYVMNADGSDLRRISDDTTSVQSPSWSPTCEQIAFEGPGGDIYTMNADGSGVFRVTSGINNGANQFPSWSPTGEQIAFTSYRDANAEIYVINVDGTGEKRLTNDGDGGGWAIPNDWWPSWSHDGMQIAFQTDRDGNYEIYIMNADGTGATRLTNDRLNDMYPAWSSSASEPPPPPPPPGGTIAFASNRDGGGNDEIYVMNTDGTGVTQLTGPAQYSSYDPAWSPDGTRIVFTSTRDVPFFDLWVMNADGTGVTRLTDSRPFLTDTTPAWSG